MTARPLLSPHWSAMLMAVAVNRMPHFPTFSTRRVKFIKQIIYFSIFSSILWFSSLGFVSKTKAFEKVLQRSMKANVCAIRKRNKAVKEVNALKSVFRLIKCRKVSNQCSNQSIVNRVMNCLIDSCNLLSSFSTLIMFRYLSEVFVL